MGILWWFVIKSVVIPLFHGSWPAKGCWTLPLLRWQSWKGSGWTEAYEDERGQRVPSRSLHEIISFNVDHLTAHSGYYIHLKKMCFLWHRLSELQWGIADTPEALYLPLFVRCFLSVKVDGNAVQGKEMKQRWKMATVLACDFCRTPCHRE